MRGIQKGKRDTSHGSVLVFQWAGGAGTLEKAGL
jgi:hypothetical protein